MVGGGLARSLRLPRNTPSHQGKRADSLLTLGLSTRPIVAFGTQRSPVQIRAARPQTCRSAGVDAPADWHPGDGLARMWREGRNLSRDMARFELAQQAEFLEQTHGHQ